MSAEITLAGAITGLVTEKRALGYKYVSEERALARFSGHDFITDAVRGRMV